MPTGPAEPGSPAARDRLDLYPVSLVVAGLPCLVVGGGPVAARKVSGLVRCGAVVTVVALDVVRDIEELASRSSVTVERRPYRPGEAEKYRLVLTATGDPAVDRAVTGDARAGGVWVNAADSAADSAADNQDGTCMLPAVHRAGPVTVAVSTGGASPALATWLRDRLAPAAGPEVGTLAEFLEGARRELQAGGVASTAVDWRALLDGPLPALVADGRTDEARRLVDRAAAGATPPAHLDSG